MFSLILRRLIQTGFVLMIVSVIVFALVRMAPGDPVNIFLGEQQVSAEQRAEYRHALGLDQPIVVQYLVFVKNALVGDLGQSIYKKTDVTALIWPAFLATFELTMVSLLIAVILGVPLAFLAATNHGRFIDRFSSVGALFGYSMPTFWLGIMLILIFSVLLGWLPTGGQVSYTTTLHRVTGIVLLDSLLTGNLTTFWIALRHIALPSLTIGISLAATLMQVLRGSLITAKNEDFVDALRSRGLSKSRINAHLLRNAAPPTVIIMGLRIGGLLGGAIVTESVFSWPGLGLLIIDAIRARDYPLIQAGVLMMAATFVIVSLIADIIHIFLDPRIRQSGASAS